MNFVTDDIPDPSRAAPAVPLLPSPPGASAALEPAVARFSRPWTIAAAVLGGLAVAAFVSALHTQQRLRALEEQLVERQRNAQDDATEAKVLAKQALDGLREASGKLGVLDEHFAETRLQRTQVEDMLQSMSRSRDENVLADVEASIRVAMQQAALTGSPDPIVATLRQADDRLARDANPRLERVRRAIARDLDRVRATSAVDVPLLAIRLDEAVRLVDDLPLVATPERAAAAGRTTARPAGRPANAAAAPDAAPASAPAYLASLQRGWDAFGASLLGEIHQAVRVTSIAHPEAMLVSPEQSFFLRENLKLRLLNARLSLLSRQFDLAQADLQQAQSALERYFDRGSRRVAAMADLLRQVASQARQVSFPRPDDTLAALGAAAAGR
jgi:uroporphyrin-3 C-methyltransferase